MTIAILTALRSPPPKATASTSAAIGSRVGAGTVTSTTVTVTVENGEGPYGIVWARLSGSTGVAAVNGTSFSTAFSGTITSLGETLETVMRGTVTDARGEISTVDVTVYLFELS